MISASISEEDYNKRLINVMAFRVANNTMCEESAITIAKDTWRTATGKFTNRDEKVFNRMWRKYFNLMVKLESFEVALVNFE